MACSTPNKDYLANEIRMVLVGKTGVGKSGTCNTILGHKKFRSVPAGRTVTKFCEHASLKRFGRNLQVVDVPGFRDMHSSKEELHQQIMQCVALVSPGIHAILFVVRIGRYTEEDVTTVEEFIQLFGPKSKDFVIVVFTGEDDLDEDYDLQTFIQESDVSLKKFLKEVNDRYISVNNKATAEEKNRFVERLLHEIEQLLRDNERSYYSCDMLDKAEEQIKKLEDKRVKEIEEKNQERDDKFIAEAIEEYKAQLAAEKVTKEEETQRVEEKQDDINNQIDTEHHLEARCEAREEMSQTIKQIDPAMITALVMEQTKVNTVVKKEEKSDAGLYTAMGVGATAGAAAGALGGPAGAVIGVLAGATYGAFLSWSG